MTYPKLPDGVAAIEEETLALWRAEDLFRKTLAREGPAGRFVFYEGPPTANGRPGLHHILSRTIKDLVCRHRAMRGHSVTRIAGWDTHGLPVEIEAEKRLGISGKPEIEAFGIAEFNQVCKESVFTYKKEWEELSERIGYWLEYSRPYVTFHEDYVESVWSILKRFADEELVYRGRKSVPYCPRCGTVLSSHEVAQGYRAVEDPSLVFSVRASACASGGDRTLLAWTTTPWTVPSNVALAVNPELAYAEVEHDGEIVVVAESRVESLFGEDARVVGRARGSSLVGVRYGRPLDLLPQPAESNSGWRVLAADWVGEEEGTGIVHVAPAFGAEDYALGLANDLPFLNPVDEGGCFEEEVRLVGGRFVKDADESIIEELARKGRLFSSATVTHAYPHCWRCDSPLLHMARDSWFVATSERKREMIAGNANVGWRPPEIGENRFGEWLRGNVDWALSRDRYWGTPLPVWVCSENPEHLRWVGSLAELDELAGGLPPGFDPHRPFIDRISWPCECCSGEMRRSPAVIDVWFDSGAMPFAQWHYPFENVEEFEDHFPADFICEGLDQTRGWFYSLMAISVLLGRGAPFRNVIVNDLVLDAQGRKMSKSRGNVVDPWDAIAEHGADPLRWYFVTASNPWSPMRYDADHVAETGRRFFGTLLNTYQFFALYANVEEWRSDDAADFSAKVGSVLDRWLLSRIAAVSRMVDACLEDYQITKAYRALADFVTDDLSNWYVRRGRARYWGTGGAGKGLSDDQSAAFETMWTALRTVSLLLAPVAPMVADWLHRALTGESVHMGDFPRGGERDEELEAEMAMARTIASLGRSAREAAGIRVRQPLGRLRIVLPGNRQLSPEVMAVVADELNVRRTDFLEDVEELVTLVALPNYRALGPRFGKRTQAAAEAIRALDRDALAGMRQGLAGAIEVDGDAIEVAREWLAIEETGVDGLVVRSEAGVTVALDPRVTEELRSEGLARELVNRIQRLRKDSRLLVTDRIRLWIDGDESVVSAAREHDSFISGETLALGLEVDGADERDGYARELVIDGLKAKIRLARVGPTERVRR